jgi:hypothetical protein
MVNNSIIIDKTNNTSHPKLSVHKKGHKIYIDNAMQFPVSPGTQISSTNKTDRHDITEILVKVALSTITPNH